MNDYLSLDNIKDVYEERVQPKAGRGIDRMSVNDFDKDCAVHFEIIHRKCLDGSYKFSPYLQRLILKGRGKEPRVISIPTVRDKIVLSLMLEALQEYCPAAVKRELPNVKVRNLAQYIDEQEELPSLHRVDVENYYGSIDKDILLTALKEKELPDLLITLVRRAVSTPTVPSNYRKKDKKDFKMLCEGVPQGLPISNILAEIYLEKFDAKLKKTCHYYDRYVDDIIAFSDDEDFEDDCSDQLQALKLSLNTEKSHFCTFNDCTSFLGYELSNGVITVNKRNFEKFLMSISMMFVRLRKAIFIDDAKDKKKRIGRVDIKQAFIEDLNVKLAGGKLGTKRYGWIQYFSQITDRELLYKIDWFVEQQFERSIFFDSVPRKLKKVSRAYYEIRYRWRETDYIHDYDAASSSARKKWLFSRGLAQGTFSKEQLDRLYAYHVGQFLSQTEQDLGTSYKI